MTNLRTLFDQIDVSITNWMVRFGIVLLRVSVGIVFFWFGALKFFPGLSPAQELATRTIDVLTFGLIPPNVSILVLATWECLIGIGLIFGVFMRPTLLLFFLQMLGTLTPIFFFPLEVFSRIPYAPTLEGQYIIKNIVLISAGLVISATMRGGVKTLRVKGLNYRPESALNTHIVSLEAYFREHPPASIKEAQIEIETITGVQRNETQVREFLKKNSISVAAESG